MAWKTRTILSVLAAGTLGCGANIIESASDELGDEATETVGTEDEIGDGETGSSGTSSDDGMSTSDSTTSDSTTSDSTTSDSTTSDDSTTDSTSEDTTTTTESTSEESTDTVMDTACVDPISFLIQAIDYDGESGWDPTMSTLGEGMVMAWDEVDNYDWISWTLDIPCDDTWHIWVRAIEEESNDSLWVRVDGEPMDWGIFEIDCTDSPWDPVYEWKQLNLRGANQCQYIYDPWVFDWTVGKHELELAHRESWAISKIWVTNTGNNPP